MNVGRNDKCPCGSGKKYKSCCLPKHRVEKQLEQGRFKQCIHPRQNECSEKITRAHSIQNNKILRRIARQGKVYMVNPQFTEHSFGLDMKPKGRKVATIFTGFCNHHDTEAFESIENRDYGGDVEQDFSFAYRAFAFEYHRAQEAFKAVPPIVPPEFEPLLQGFRARNRDLAYYKRVFDKAILSEDFEVIDTVQLKFEGAANVAVCSSFFLEYDVCGNRLNDARSLKADRSSHRRAPL